MRKTMKMGVLLMGLAIATAFTSCKDKETTVDETTINETTIESDTTMVTPVEEMPADTVTVPAP